MARTHDAYLVQDNGGTLSTDEIHRIACAEIKRRNDVPKGLLLRVVEEITTAYGQVIITELPSWEVKIHE